MKKKNDIILIATILIVAIISFFVLHNIKKEGEKVIIQVNGEVYKELPLSKNTTYRIEQEDGSYNTLVIEDGYARMIDASCPDKLCVQQHKIQKSKESIVCLPNKVVIEIESNLESDFDAIARK